MLGSNALTVIDGDARIACRRLQEVLGFARIDHLHRLIRTREDELRDFGEVFLFEGENPSAKGGRPIKTYLLNEHQATAVCLWAETPKARAARKLIVEVFTAWRRGTLSEMPQAVRDPFMTIRDRVAHVADHLMLLGGMDDVALKVTHLPIWKNGRRPHWWANIELRRFVTVSHRQMTLQDCRDLAVQRFGAGVPSVSGLQRYWAALDGVLGPGERTTGAAVIPFPGKPMGASWCRSVAGCSGRPKTVPRACAESARGGSPRLRRKQPTTRRSTRF